ncbi:uncharacterized membrane protein YtjA (UPF0391 family) [Algoriphagus sp. 4150]|uniref:DUF3179 domain-containing (seleno)protein n=1 Tax=Algoriphagus sp. 4150 TaxID=2817756 RepID=UPI0028634D1E|nr:DUF3179 domain-containing (seleno)protein [Algoriphagus sp. 4150]MDR7128862.1 uncharacterized membrane protein YtjA (UPF0391 family) [Algoriphagus sp. 4150]
MKILFYCGLGFLLLFEFLKIYFIMPFPGSQQWDSIDFAYFLHRYKVVFWITALILTGIGFKSAISGSKKWISFLCLVLTVGLIGFFNFKMAADAMFKEPKELKFQTRETFEGNDSTLVIAIQNGQVAKAYPIRYIVYHHQVRDILTGNPVMITYCSVCRTGRVYSPFVDGNAEKFRLVGMDHFNAMFEDSQTGSWWQQATGEAIAGKLKGEKLDEIESIQLTAGAFFKAFPQGEIMAEDPNFISKYDSLGKFEKGTSESKLTGTDPFSWNEKSWVIGVDLGNSAKAYDWNSLTETESIRDRVGEKDIVLLLNKDTQSFVVFEIPQGTREHLWNGDTLYLDSVAYSFTGKSLDPKQSDLKRLKAYQEFWHSWRTFKPNTEKFN